MAELRIPFNRWGGNATTRYNWKANGSNHAKDWYFESIPGESDAPGGALDDIAAETFAAGSDVATTIPIMGRVAKFGPNRAKLASFSVAKYGPQTAVDPYFRDAGNGIAASSGQPIVGNDPNDANIAVDAVFQQDWVRHIVDRWGTAANGGVRYYTLDNEPSLWHETHRDAHPEGARMEEVKNAFVTHAAKIKEVDPGAIIIGPEEWGWSGYLYSGYDLQWGARNGFRDLPDRAAHNNADYMPWFLEQVRQAEGGGASLLDVFTLHYYPQGGEYGNDVSPAMQQRRNRSTRSLWDPTYVDETWINTAVELIPRMKRWAAIHSAKTLTGITEYNWGAEGHINGATAQADILGIFGREGLNVAARWAIPETSTPTYKVFKLYRNYDGSGAAFGDVSVSAHAPDPDSLSVFAAQRTGDGALTIIAVNKIAEARSANIRLSAFVAGRLAEAWQLTATNAITRLPDVAVSRSALAVTLPAQSITLFVVPTTAKLTLPAGMTLTTVVGTPQTAEAGARFPLALRVLVRDRISNPVSGIAVRFSAPDSGPSAGFAGRPSIIAVTNADGIATATTLTANGEPGRYAVTATATGVTAPAVFSLTNAAPVSAPATGGGASPAAGTWQNVTPPSLNLSGSAFNADNFGVMDVLVDPARASDFYAFTTHQGVWKSTDFGRTWAKINTGSNGGDLDRGKLWTAAIDPNPARNPATPPTLWTATGNAAAGVWKSTNGGVSWNAHATRNSTAISDSDNNNYFGDDVYSLDVDPYDSQHLLAGFHGYRGLSESTDGGNSWRTIRVPEKHGGSVYPFFVNTGSAATTRGTWLTQAQWTSNTDGTWRTADGGTTWTQVGQYEHKHGSTQLYQANGVIYLPSTGANGIFRSTDYGQTWKQVSSGQVNAVYGTPTTLYSQDSFATGGDYAPNLMFATLPDGTGWFPMPQVPAMRNGAKRVAVSFDGANYIVVSGNWLGGIWRYVEPAR